MNKYSGIFKQLKRINRSKDSEFRSDLCLQVTGGRSSSLTDLSDGELRELDFHLRTVAAEIEVPTFDEMSGERMRKKAFAIFRELGWYKNDKPDYSIINTWLDKHGYLHKNINRYTNKELPKLISQIENIQRKDYEKSDN